MTLLYTYSIAAALLGSVSVSPIWSTVAVWLLNASLALWSRSVAISQSTEVDPEFYVVMLVIIPGAAGLIALATSVISAFSLQTDGVMFNHYIRKDGIKEFTVTINGILSIIVMLLIGIICQVVAMPLTVVVGSVGVLAAYLIFAVLTLKCIPAAEETFNKDNAPVFTSKETLITFLIWSIGAALSVSVSEYIMSFPYFAAFSIWWNAFALISAVYTVAAFSLLLRVPWGSMVPTKSKRSNK